MNKLPGWPLESDVNRSCSEDSSEAEADYYSALYLAWEARCRLAVAMLEKCYSAFAFYQDELPAQFAGAHDKVFETLEAIGELPPPSAEGAV